MFTSAPSNASSNGLIPGKMISNCVIIGSGNVATHLAKALSAHIEILQVYSRDIGHAAALASAISPSCRAINDAADICRDADLYLMSVTDDSILPILDKLQDYGNGIWAHTSGSVDMNVFDGRRSRYGVFYPLQTFSKDKYVDVQSAPFFIEGSSADVEGELLSLASAISGNVRLLNSEGRRRLHIAAVFACNFVNYMWTVADRQLHLCGTDIHIFDPLLKETLGKIGKMPPIEAQTGPARRGDTRVMQKHIDMLGKDDALLYELISKQIYNTYHEQD